MQVLTICVITLLGTAEELSANHLWAQEQGVFDITLVEIPQDTTQAHYFGNQISHIPAGQLYSLAGHNVYTRASNDESITSNHAVHSKLVVTGNTIEYLLDNSSDIYLIVYGMIRSDRLMIQGSCVSYLSSGGPIYPK